MRKYQLLRYFLLLIPFILSDFLCPMLVYSQSTRDLEWKANDIYNKSSSSSSIKTSSAIVTVLGAKRISTTYYPCDSCSSCGSNSDITMTSQLTSIPNTAYSGCSTIITVYIPTSVTAIGEDAFSYNPSLTSVSCLLYTSPSPRDS